MTWDALCDMRVYVVKFLNYEGGERDVEQRFEQIEFGTYDNLNVNIKYGDVYASYILFEDPISKRPERLSEQNLNQVTTNTTLYAYFDILKTISKKKAFVVRSVSYETVPSYTEPDIVIHHSNYNDLVETLKFRGSAPVSTFIVDKNSHLVVALVEENYNTINSGDDIYTNFHFSGSPHCGSRFEELSSIDARLAGIHIKL